jgi:hypothetical protein
MPVLVTIEAGLTVSNSNRTPPGVWKIDRPIAITHQGDAVAGVHESPTTLGLRLALLD